MDWVANPVDSAVISDGVVPRVHADDFKELVGAVLSQPVRVENSQALHLSAHSLLGRRPQIPGELKLVYPLRGGLPVDDSLGHRSFPSASYDFNPVNYESLFCLVAQTTGLIWS